MSAAFVPSFDHDIFVSYAHVDNQPLLVPGGVPAGWVDTLVENLKRLLSQQLGRKDWGKLWFDPNLRGDEAFPPVLREAVSRAAIPCPYPGLRPFRRNEADLFFGREA